jgi:hypothetical protein
MATDRPPPYRPLYWPDGGPTPERWGLYATLYLVMVGSVIAGCLHGKSWFCIALTAGCAVTVVHARRGRPTAQHIADQLRARPTFPSEAWGSTQRAALAEQVARAIADEIGWPNAHFLPDDRLEIMLFRAGHDGGETFAIRDRLQVVLRHSWRWHPAETFGQLVDQDR